MGRRKNGPSMTSKKNFNSWKAIFLGFPQFFLNWICSFDCHWILYVCTVFKKAIRGSLFCFQWLPSARKRGSFKGLQASQEVLEWLEEITEMSAEGTSYGPAGGHFASRNTRKQFGNSNGWGGEWNSEEANAQTNSQNSSTVAWSSAGGMKKEEEWWFSHLQIICYCSDSCHQVAWI